MPYPSIQFVYYNPIHPSGPVYDEPLTGFGEDIIADASPESWSLYPLPLSPTTPFDTAGANFDPFTKIFHYPTVSRRNNRYLYRGLDSEKVSDEDWDEIKNLFLRLPTESIPGQFARGNTFIWNPPGHFAPGTERYKSFARVLKGWHVALNEHCTIQLGWVDEHGNEDAIWATAHLHRNGVETIKRGDLHLWVKELGKLSYNYYDLSVGDQRQAPRAQQPPPWTIPQPTRTLPDQSPPLHAHAAQMQHSRDSEQEALQTSIADPLRPTPDRRSRYHDADNLIEKDTTDLSDFY